MTWRPSHGRGNASRRSQATGVAGSRTFVTVTVSGLIIHRCGRHDEDADADDAAASGRWAVVVRRCWIREKGRPKKRKKHSLAVISMHASIWMDTEPFGAEV